MECRERVEWLRRGMSQSNLTRIREFGNRRFGSWEDLGPGLPATRPLGSDNENRKIKDAEPAKSAPPESANLRQLHLGGFAVWIKHTQRRGLSGHLCVLGTDEEESKVAQKWRSPRETESALTSSGC